MMIFTATLRERLADLPRAERLALALRLSQQVPVLADPTILTLTREPGTIPYCPQTPFEKQQIFLSLTGQEALFGGSAGPGKSSALLMAALQYVEVPRYAALLLRRTYADLALPGALMDRAAEWLRPTAARWREPDKTWVFPSGATLSF